LCFAWFEAFGRALHGRLFEVYHLQSSLIVEVFMKWRIWRVSKSTGEKYLLLQGKFDCKTRRLAVESARQAFKRRFGVTMQTFKERQNYAAFFFVEVVDQPFLSI